MGKFLQKLKAVWMTQERQLQRAKKSFYVTREWRDMDSQTRGDFLLKIADAIEATKMNSPCWTPWIMENH